VNPAIEDRFRKNAKTLGKPFADTSRNIAALLPAILPSLKSKNRPVANRRAISVRITCRFFQKAAMWRQTAH
jgi:hypothetical protein